jgi:hypothetical protein
MNSYFIITDGTTSIDLLDAKSWTVKSWHPEMAQPKGGGIFRSSPLVDGRRLSMRKFDNAIESVTLVVSSTSENRLIYELQELSRLLQKATEYWTSSWQNEPVWIEAQGPCEEERRYAIIMDYRMSGFNNPYAQPFFSAFSASAMDNIILSLERGHWQDVAPGSDGICAKVSSQYELPNAVVGGSFYGIDQYDDTVYSVSSPTLYSTYTTLIVGNAPFVIPDMPYGVSNIGLRFDSVTVPVGATIMRATLSMKANGTEGTDPLQTYVVGQSPSGGDPADFNETRASFLARWDYFTSQIALWFIPPIVTGTTYSTDVTNIVQEIIDNANWASGDPLVLFVNYAGTNPTDEVRYFYDYDNPHANGPALYIEYTAGSETVGVDPTCANSVYIGNKHNTGAITHAYYYDYSAGGLAYDVPAGYTGGQLIGAATPFNLLPAVPGVGDRIYFGSCDTLSSYGPFFNIVFDIGTAAVDISGVWKYYNGVGWVDLDLATTGSYVCGNANFIETGASHVTFRIPPEQTTKVINTYTGYWICYEVTDVDVAPATPTQANVYIYTVLNPYIDIDELEVGGDIPAASRIIIDCGGCNSRRTSTLNIALRSLDRGSDFTAYLNVANNKPGITFVSSSATHIEVSSKSPCGYVDETSDVRAVLTEECYWLLDPTIATQYIGSYHVFVRLDQINGVAGDVRLRARAVMGTDYNVNYSDTNKTAIITYSHAVDLGKLVIPSPYSLRQGDQVSRMKICLDVYNPLGREIDIFDLVLFPTDEWMGTFSTAASGLAVATGHTGKRYDIDNITNPRTYRATLTNIVNDTTQTIDAELMRVASAPPMLQANRDQRLWFFQTYGEELKAHFETISSVRIQRANRYLVMRGQR